MGPRSTILAATLAALAATAQDRPAPGRGSPGPVGVAVAAGAFEVLPGRLRGGGRMGLGLQDLAAVAILRSGGWPAAGLAVKVDRIAFDFDDGTSFGGGEPWGDVTILSLSVPVSMPALGGDLRAAPSLRWAREDGARAGSSQIVGGILSYTTDATTGLTIGLGAALFAGMEDAWGFPFVAVRWQIDEALRLGNPSPLGPATPAGLELAWRFASAWEVGGGACYRTERFRLADAGPAPEGIGAWTGMPAWVRLNRRLGPAQVSLFAGAVFAGRVQVDDRDGARLETDRIDPAPMIGLAASVRF
ncbi:MAG: hypothetical protein FJ221_02320 [Lentisphaerae bacterium]|nr:hypothetical protein [Lentisphaerota bacterium]